MARNCGEDPEAEDLEPYGYRCYYCLCVACTPGLYSPKRRSLCAARSLADCTSQITALRGAGRRSSPTCLTLSSGSPA
eukprot:3466695-Prymnesium_polylepis.1